MVPFKHYVVFKLFLKYISCHLKSQFCSFESNYLQSKYKKEKNYFLIHDHIVQEILQYFPVRQFLPKHTEHVNDIQSGVKAYST